MTRVDIMVDIETLGTDTNSTIFQISGVSFDIESGGFKSIYNGYADISKNETYDMHVSGSTLKWWVKNHPETFAEILEKGEGSSSDLVKSFHNWLQSIVEVHGSENVYLWGNGILFDNNILKNQMEAELLKYPIHFRNDRDVRTIVDLATTKLNVSVKDFRDECYKLKMRTHDAFIDVSNQISMVSTAHNILLGDVSDEKQSIH